MQNNKQPRSLSQILSSGKTDSTKKLLLAEEMVKVEVRPYINPRTREMKLVFTLTFSDGYVAEFGSNPSRFKEANGYENEDLTKKVLSCED